MLQRLQIRNFKGWSDTGPLRLAPITGLFGTNSSGKTALHQALLLLKQTVESVDRKTILHMGDQRSLVDLGTFNDVVRGHDTSAVLSFAFEWTVPGKKLHEHPEAPTTSQQVVKFEVAIQQFGQEESAHLAVKELSYSLNGKEVRMRERGKRGEYDLLTSGTKIPRKSGRRWPLPGPVKFYGFPDETFNYFKGADWLGDLALSLEELMSSIDYVGPLREYPQRTYTWAGESPDTVGRKGEYAVHAMLAARAADKKIGRGEGKARRYRSFDEWIGQWLKDLGLIHSFALKPTAPGRRDYEVRVKIQPSSSEVLITDVGFGVSQVLPVLVQCYYSEPGNVIIFEQPEIHLHPRVQAGLADVFIDAALNQPVQIIVESHSEHLLRRLLRRVAEEKVPAETLSLYFCHHTETAPAIDALRVDPYGDISNWPEGFFGDEMSELAAKTKAALARRRKLDATNRG